MSSSSNLHRSNIGLADDTTMHQYQHVAQQPNIQDARFICSICTEAVIEPVVTQCGHLYCWPCLYRWLEPGMTPVERNSLMGLTSVVLHSANYDPTKRICPVCRAPCSVKRIVPIYVRTDGATASNVYSTTNGTNRGLSDQRDDYTTNEPDHHGNRIASTTSNSDGSIINQELVDGGNNIVVEDVNSDDEYDIVGPTESTSRSISPIPSTETSSSTNTGLRQRLRFRSTDSDIISNSHVVTTRASDTTNETSTTSTVVPRRPIARTSSNLQLAENEDVAAAAVAAAAPNRSNNNNGSPITQQHRLTHPLSPTNGGHPASLAHGMLPLVQQALRHVSLAAANGTNGSHDFVPPRHRLEGMNSNNNYFYMQQPNQDRASTEFLSWLLLLLGSFVLFCLLMF